jgi:hypothetical protein
MDLELLCNLHPQLYHMAHKDALASILRHGLLSTSALLDLFEVFGERRAELETKMRRNLETLAHPKLGTVVLRDQKPIGSDAKLQRSLKSVSVSDWHQLLNSKVFFWVTRERVSKLRNARAYKRNNHLLLTLRTKDVVQEYKNRVRLCHINSGCCMPIAHPRSPDFFRTIESFDYDYWRRKGRTRKNIIVEFVVEYKIENISRFMVDHEML